MNVVSRIWVSKRRAFGRPCVRGTKLRADLLHDRWLAGESEDEIADDMNVDVRDVVAAIYFHLGRTRVRYSLQMLRPGGGKVMDDDG
jgi:uncharacterized protein (DUF433 family)